MTAKEFAARLVCLSVAMVLSAVAGVQEAKKLPGGTLATILAMAFGCAAAFFRGGC